MQAHSHGPVLADLFELERRVSRVLLQQLETGVRQPLHLLWQRIEALPEASCRPVFHRSVQRPSSRSFLASSAYLSSRPAATSSANWRSHASASYSANQRRNKASSSGESLRMASSIPSMVFIVEYPRRWVPGATRDFLDSKLAQWQRATGRRRQGNSTRLFRPRPARACRVSPAPCAAA